MEATLHLMMVPTYMDCSLTVLAGTVTSRPCTDCIDISYLYFIIYVLVCSLGTLFEPLDYHLPVIFPQSINHISHYNPLSSRAVASLYHGPAEQPLSNG